MDRLPQADESAPARELGWRIGGSSANLACGLASLGHDVELIGVFGSDAMADHLYRELDQRGVRTSRSIRVDLPAPRALILIDEQGERTIIELDHVSAADAYPISALPDLRGAECIFVESYERFPWHQVGELTDTLVVATPPPADAMRWPADVLIGSEHQYASAMLVDPFETAREIAGPRLRWTIVTRGARGADAFGPGGSCHVDAVPVQKQVDATGAGDAFAAGLVHGLLERRDIERALQLGSRYGAAAVETLQSIPPDWIEGDAR
jgi:sugar/nucleoside kinase (ribokinase family)